MFSGDSRAITELCLLILYLLGGISVCTEMWGGYIKS